MTTYMGFRGYHRVVWVLVVVAAMATPSAYAAVSQELGVGAASSEPAKYRAILDKYCVTCHNERLKTGGLLLDKADLAHVPAAAETWEKVILKLRAGMMPPQGRPRPDARTSASLVTFLETTLDRAASVKPNPGQALLRRLNRSEYTNAIRDLLALDVDAASLLPPDDSGYGFDNNADLLGVSRTLLERYVSAAGKISALAIGDPGAGPDAHFYLVRQDLSQDQHIEGLPLGTVGGLLVRPTLPLDGEYLLQVQLFRTNTNTMKGLEYVHQLEITVDGKRVALQSVGGPDDWAAMLENVTLGSDAVDARLRVRVPLKAGPRAIGVAFLQKNFRDTLLLQPFLRSSADTYDAQGVPHVRTLTVTGPFNATGVGDTPSRRRIFTCHPTRHIDEPPCARRIITSLARRAYRGQATQADIDRLLGFFEEGRKQGGFESGIALALRRTLASPKFLVRAERDSDVAAGTISSSRVSNFELASRLSFFLWSSIPDDRLLEAARQGALANPVVLINEVRRMLADPRARALTTNFADQWLYLRNLQNSVPNTNEYPDFDDNLRDAFRHETELLFESVMHEDRSVLDLLTADYTFVNERLAKHYGIPNIYGSQFRRVSVIDETRKGLLGHGSVLLVTSHADRTSPVLRGKWILDNLFGAPPPPPPPNVSTTLPDKASLARPQTMREQMEEHRRNPVCSSCHSLMDPIGFSLENFDGVGAWRTHDEGNVINASGTLMDGTHVNGPVDLRKALLQRSDLIVNNITKKLLTYALGRGVTYSDMPVVRDIVRDASRRDYRFSALVLGIVKSSTFQTRVKTPPSPRADQVASK
jgi:mono/diheme cytochrome c family protein